jgi:hypothetical protein
MEIGLDSIFVHTIHIKDATRIALSPLPSIDGHIRSDPLIIHQPLNRTNYIVSSKTVGGVVRAEIAKS